MESFTSTPSPFDLHDPVSRSSITFDSESDALFASFCLGGQLGTKLLLPPHIIDALLGFLRHPRFHIDQLTFTSTTDIENKISQSRRVIRNRRLRHSWYTMNKRMQYRREAALERREVALKHHTPYYGDILAGNVPRLVLELVAEELVQSTVVLRARLRCDGIFDRELRCLKQTREQIALWNTCFVHRSWTAVTQRFLGHCITVQSNADAYSFLASPLIGPSTRQLCYHLVSDIMPSISPCSYQCSVWYPRQDVEDDTSEEELLDENEYNSYDDHSNHDAEEDGYEDGAAKVDENDSYENCPIQNDEGDYDSYDDHSNHDAEEDGYEDGAAEDYENDSHDNCPIQNDEGDYDEEYNPKPDQAGNFSCLLSICTGIRELRIHRCINISSIGSDPFHRIAQLQNLKVLSLDESDALLEVCTALPNMRKLTSLTLHRFKCPKEHVIPPSLDELSPPSSLTDVVVHGCSKNRKTEILLSWLFRPREAYSVLSTTLDPLDLFDLPSDQLMMCRVLGPALIGLKTTTILSYGKYMRCMSDLLSICTSLRIINIRHPSPFCIKGEFDWMPPNIEQLRIDGSAFCNMYRDIEAFIRKIPNLHSLCLVQDQESCPRKLIEDYVTIVGTIKQDMKFQGRGELNELHSLKLYCEQRGIKMDQKDVSE